MKLNLPKKYENLPELNDKLNPDNGSIWNMLNLHYTDNKVIIYNPLTSIQFDVDYSQLQQLSVSRIGIVRWDKLANYIYGESSWWYILAQLNNVIDPFAEIPKTKDLIYYIESEVIGDVFKQIRN